jgi:hypothetical protein
MARVPGLPVAFIAIGGVLVWSGVENEPVTAIFRTLASGKTPAKGPGETFATPGTTSAGTTEPGSANVIPAGGTVSGATEKANQLIGMGLVAAAGWGAQWPAFNSIVMAESGWNQLAENASGAYGIPQALPGSKMASAGANWQTSAATQIRWMIGYIRSGQAGGRNAGSTPDSVWAFHQANGWY